MLFLVKASVPGKLISPVQTVQTSLHFRLVHQVLTYLLDNVFPELNGTNVSVFSVVQDEAVMLDLESRFDSYSLILTSGNIPTEEDCTDIFTYKPFADGIAIRVNGRPLAKLFNHVPLFTDLLTLESIQTELKPRSYYVSDIMIGQDPGRSSSYLNFDDVRAPGETVIRILCTRRKRIKKTVFYEGQSNLRQTVVTGSAEP